MYSNHKRENRSIELSNRIKHVDVRRDRSGNFNRALEVCIPLDI